MPTKNRALTLSSLHQSNDKGRDVIATSHGVGCIRYFDQVKAYGPGHLVTADDVRAMVGVLTLEGNVSKGIITTTSDFAPGTLVDENIKRFMPYRLELKPRDALLGMASDHRHQPTERRFVRRKMMPLETRMDRSAKAVSVAQQGTAADCLQVDVKVVRQEWS